MRLNVLVVPDKFKGTLTAQEAAEAIARGWTRARAEDKVELLPMSDGGDGFGQVLSDLLGAQPQVVESVDAAHQPLCAQWWWHDLTRTAIVESAKIVGLAQLPRKRFHPFELDTAGLGPVFEAVTSKSPRHCLVGIGGSATNDAGFGLARALGWTFRDGSGGPIDTWTKLDGLEEVGPRREPLGLGELVVAVDVQNPLLGPTGASRIYGPQKGLKPEDFPKAERCLGRLADILDKQRPVPAATEPGAGAAGGLGFGLRAFLDARLEPGFEIFAHYSALQERIARSQLVITAEGSIDLSTLMGKGVGEIASRCHKLGVPCIGLAGALGELSSNDIEVTSLFTRLHGVSPGLTTAESSRANASHWLSELATKAAREGWG